MKREKSALEATILELTVKKSKIEAFISARATNGSLGGSNISSLGGNSQVGNAFWGRAEKAQTKKYINIRCVTDFLLWIVFQLKICTNPYTHNKSHDKNKGETILIFRLWKEKYHR